MGPDRFREALARLTAACERYGRDVGELQIVDGVHPSVQLDPAESDMAGQAARAVEGLCAYAALGVTHMKVSIRTKDPVALLEMLDVYGREVLPAYRS